MCQCIQLVFDGGAPPVYLQLGLGGTCTPCHTARYAPVYSTIIFAHTVRVYGVRCTVNSLSTECTVYIELCSVHSFIYTAYLLIYYTVMCSLGNIRLCTVLLCTQHISGFGLTSQRAAQCNGILIKLAYWYFQ